MKLEHSNVEFISFRENVDTGSAMGKALISLCGILGEMERNLICERVRAGMRTAKLEGRRIGREPLNINPMSLQRDRARGLSLREVAKAHGISKASVCRLLRASKATVSEGFTSAN